MCSSGGAYAGTALTAASTASGREAPTAASTSVKSDERPATAIGRAHREVLRKTFVPFSRERDPRAESERRAQRSNPTAPSGAAKHGDALRILAAERRVRAV